MIWCVVPMLQSDVDLGCVRLREYEYDADDDDNENSDNDGLDGVLIMLYNNIKI